MKTRTNQLATMTKTVVLASALSLSGLVTCALPSIAGTFKVENPGDSHVNSTVSGSTTSGYATIGSSFKWKVTGSAGVSLYGGPTSLTDSISWTYHVRIIWTPSYMGETPPAKVYVVSYSEGYTGASGAFPYSSYGTASTVNTSDIRPPTASISGTGSGSQGANDYSSGTFSTSPPHLAWTVYENISKLSDGRYGFDAIIEAANTQIQASIGKADPHDQNTYSTCSGVLGRNIWIHSLAGASSQNQITTTTTILDGLPDGL